MNNCEYKNTKKAGAIDKTEEWTKIEGRHIKIKDYFVMHRRLIREKLV